MLGYDFMLDEKLNVWLIEVNASPACDYSTPITEELVKELLTTGLPRLIIDGDNGRVPVDGDELSGNFERIYN